MAEENTSQEFRIKNIDETRNYLKLLIEEIINWRRKLKWINEWKAQKGLCNSKLY